MDTINVQTCSQKHHPWKGGYMRKTRRTPLPGRAKKKEFTVYLRTTRKEKKAREESKNEPI
jgi:hypothetical protein